MTFKNRTRITFDFEGEMLRESRDRLTQIVCSSHWSSGIDIYGLLNSDHRLFFDFVDLGIIVIDEFEYEIQEPCADRSAELNIESMLGKRSGHHVLRDMAALLAGETLEMSARYRNTIYLPNLRAFARADGMKPEDVAEMLSLEDCDRIILFPYFPLDDKSAYYELSLGVEKERFIGYMNRVEEQRKNEMFKALRQAEERCKAGYKATLRNEIKSDWKSVEQVTYRAFRDAPPTGAGDDGKEALLARKLRGRDTFVPELDYVAELDGFVIGSIMYTRSKVVGEGGDGAPREWGTLTFGPVSVLPKYQRQGVGSALIRKTLEAARELGHRAVLIFGHESYYPRFGFKPASEYGITAADGRSFPAFMALPLFDGALDGVHGRLICDEAYADLDRDESDKLNAKLAEPMDVDEYIDAQPLPVQQTLRRVRGAIRSAMPDAAERIFNQMPTYWQRRNLVQFAAQIRHLGFYPGAEALGHFAPRLARCKTSKGSVQFPYNGFGDAQLALIAEIAEWCAAQNAK